MSDIRKFLMLERANCMSIRKALRDQSITQDSTINSHSLDENTEQRIAYIDTILKGPQALQPQAAPAPEPVPEPTPTPAPEPAPVPEPKPEPTPERPKSPPSPEPQSEVPQPLTTKPAARKRPSGRMGIWPRPKL